MTGRDMATMISPGVKELPNSVPPAHTAREFEVVTSLIEEINSRFAAGLSTELSSVRNPCGSSEANLLGDSPTEKKLRLF